eukprot:751419-Hanusia_phi.AAC.1
MRGMRRGWGDLNGRVVDCFVPDDSESWVAVSAHQGFLSALMVNIRLFDIDYPLSSTGPLQQ